MPILTPQASDSGGLGAELESMGSGYFTGMAPIALAASSPASDEPDTKMPGRSSGAKEGFKVKPLIL